MAEEDEKTFFTVKWTIQNVGIWLREIKRVLVTNLVSDSNESDNHWSMYIYRNAFKKRIEIGLRNTKHKDPNLTISLQNSKVYLLKSENSEMDHFKAEIECKPDITSDINFVIPEFEIFNNRDVYFPKDILTILCKIPGFNKSQCFINTVLEPKVFFWNIESFSESPFSIKKFQINLVNITIQCTWLPHKKIGFDVLLKNNNLSPVYYKIIHLNTNQELFENVQYLRGPKKFCIDASDIINDTFSLKCIFVREKEINVFYKDSEVASCSLINQSQESLPMAKILQDVLFDLYKNKMFCDAILRIDAATTFSVHKILLCAMSPVFCEIFEDHTLEGRTGVADVPALDPDTVKQMLVFLYNNSLEDIQWDKASKLYYAADQYKILTLKKVCLSVLKAKLSISNACLALVLAKTHQDKDLLAYVLEFIAYHDEVMYTSEWKDLEENDAIFIVKVFRKIYLKTYVQPKGSCSKGLPEVCNLIGDKSDIEISLPNALQNGLLRLYNGKRFCDATLQTDNATFPVHRNVLCAVSPVFCALFEDEAKVVDIPDMDSNTMKRMLLYIYGDSAGDFQWDEALKLYHAADMYYIQTLKKTCLSILKASISVTNACSALSLADKLKDKNFLNYVQDFICNNDEVINTEEWKDLEENHANLVVKVMRQIHLKKLKELIKLQIVL